MSPPMADAASPTPTATKGIPSVARAAPCEPAWEIDAGADMFCANRRPGSDGATATPAEDSSGASRAEGSSVASRADVRKAASSGGVEHDEAPEPPRESAAPITHAEAERAARGVLVAVMEVIDGRRSPATLSALLATGPLVQVTRLARSRRRPANAAQVRTVHVTVSSPPTTTQHKAHISGIEMCATYARGRRLFAVAAHFEARDGRVCCTALRMPS